MSIQSNHAYAHFPHFFAVNPKRRARFVLRDFAFVAVCWATFIGLIAFPVAQLIGLAVCALALFLLPDGQQKPLAVARARIS